MQINVTKTHPLCTKVGLRLHIAVHDRYNDYRETSLSQNDAYLFADKLAKVVKRCEPVIDKNCNYAVTDEDIRVYFRDYKSDLETYISEGLALDTDDKLWRKYKDKCKARATYDLTCSYTLHWYGDTLPPEDNGINTICQSLSSYLNAVDRSTNDLAYGHGYDLYLDVLSADVDEFFDPLKD